MHHRSSAVHVECTDSVIMPESRLQSIPSLILSQCKDQREWVIWEDLGALTTAQAREFWMS